MQTIRTLLLAASGILTGALVSFAESVPREVSHYDLVWNSPSFNSAGSMPIGNGDVALNVWVNHKGEICFYIAKADALTQINRLVKLGRIRLALDPNPFLQGGEMTQALRLADGRIEIVFAKDDTRQKLLIWPDANHPLVHVEAEGTESFAVTATLEIMRPEPRTLSGHEALSALEIDQRKLEGADTLVATGDDTVLWYHRNDSIWFENNLRKQHLEELIGTIEDPLADRTFGGLIRGDGFAAVDDATLRAEPATEHRLSIVAHTSRPKEVDTWKEEIRGLAMKFRESDIEAMRAAHRRYWDRFWETSFVRIRTPEEIPFNVRRLEPTREPIFLGASRENRRKFRGILGGAAISNSMVSESVLRERALAGPDQVPDGNGLAVAWRFNEAAESYSPVAGEGDLTAVVEGKVTLEDGGIRLGEETRLRIDQSPAISLTSGSFTTEFWVKLADAGEGGFLLERGDGNRSREFYVSLPAAPHNQVAHLIYRENPNLTSRLVGGTLHSDSEVPYGRWVHLAVVYDGDQGIIRHYMDGRELASSSPEYTPDLVAQQWHLTRMMFAGQGRGEMPIRFNGQLFTFASAAYNADFRRWGGGYWLQNTRLMYWPMLASGDYELMMPFFDMYVNALDLARYRTRHYFGHDGAYFPETMMYWGTYAEGSYGQNSFGFINNPWIRYYYSGNLEVLAMMHDYWEHTRDRNFLLEKYLPFAKEVIVFYDQHHERDENGLIRLYPGQALETYQDAANPANEIAGLRYLLPLLAGLPDWAVDEETRAYWKSIYEILPPLPTRELADGRIVLVAAEEKFSDARNSENPELYSIFPFRIFGIGHPDQALANLSFARRTNRSAFSWQQSDTQAALLGRTEDATDLLLSRSRGNHYRFPTFWRHGNDWAPDGCHAGNFLMTAQSMLLQEVDGEILVLPAWPEDWDVHFRLRASNNTTVEVRYVDGQIQDLLVTPETEKSRLRVMVGDGNGRIAGGAHD